MRNNHNYQEVLVMSLNVFFLQPKVQMSKLFSLLEFKGKRCSSGEETQTQNFYICIWVKHHLLFCSELF